MINWRIFLLILLLNYSICDECPREKPILKNNECQMTYCLPEEFENKTCTISNNFQKIQWMNKIHFFDDSYITHHVCPITNSKGDLFLMSQNFNFGDGDKFLYGFTSNGDGLFYDEKNDVHGSFVQIDFQSRIYPEVFNYVEYNKKGYLLSTTYESEMYLIDYANKNYTEFKVNLLSQYSDTLFKLKDYEEETYLTDFIYCDKKYNFEHCWINLRIFKFDLSKITTILDSPDKISVSHKNKLNCFQTEQNYILCVYTTEEEKSDSTKAYDHAFSLFNSKSLKNEYNETIESNFDVDCTFDSTIQLKENAFVTGYSYPDNKNKIKLMLKKLVVENEKFSLIDYIPSVEYININEDNSYSLKLGTAKRNSMAKLSETKFIVLLNEYEEETVYSYGNKKLLILICSIFNGEKNLNIKYYSINFALYGRKLIDDIKGYNLNDYIGVLIETNLESKDKNQAVFMTFGYVNATYNESKIDDNLKLNNTNSVIILKDYINEIENNLFGYEFLGVKIIEMPSEEDSGYFINNSTNKKIGKDEIVDVNTVLRFILNNNYKQNNYTISFAGVIKEPDYDAAIKYCEKDVNYPLNSDVSQKNFYEPKTLLGRMVNFTFSLSCYNSCLSCYEASNNEQDQKCKECKPNYYFQKDTLNCFDKLDGYYLDKDTKVFLPCYSKCKTCSAKEESSIKQNCDSCIEGFKFYKKSKNCLSCPKYVNIDQNGCIDVVPEGYFVDDPYLGTIGKCHEYCKTCDDYPTYWSMGCIDCKYYDPTFVPIYDGDCPSDDYYDYEEEDESEEEYLGGECPRERPIYRKNKDCSDEYCSEADFKTKACIIANLVVKDQWMNKFHTFGVIDVSYVSTETGLKNETFVLAQSQSKVNKEKYLYAFDQDGEGLFTNETNSLKYSFKRLDFNYTEYVDSVKYVKDVKNNDEFLLSTQMGDKMYLFDFIQNTTNTTVLTFPNDAYSTDTIFQIDDDTYTYFTDFIGCKFDDPSDNCYINMRKFTLENKKMNIIKEVEGNETVCSKNKLTCLFSQYDYVQCTYTTQEKNDSKYIYNHVLGFFDEETFELVEKFTLKENFYTDAPIDSMISLKEKENVYVIAYSSSANSITVLLKKIGYNTDFSEIVWADYIKEIPYINLNEKDLYLFKGAKSDRNSLFRLDDDKFALLANNFKNSDYYSSSQANGIVIYIFNIYNNTQYVSVRHYTINFKLYNTYVEGDIRPYTLNGFFGIAIELTSPERRSFSRASFFTFGYVNSTSVGINDTFIAKGATESSILKLSDYIFGIENNLFGYKFLGVKILELPDENKSGYFIYTKNGTKVSVDDIVTLDTELKFKVKTNAEEDIYNIVFAGIVQEPDYKTMNKFSEKLETFPANKNSTDEEFYNPRNITGKKVKFNFAIGEVKICYKNCKKCKESSQNEDDQKCTECNVNFYFKEGTENCYDKIAEHYYFNEETKMFSPCYKDCLTCNNKETNSTHMNCLSCENNYNFYTNSTNCLKCEKYVNYLQTECINEIPEGYFLLDEKIGTIGKCHDLCKACNKSSEIIDNIVHTNCLSCLYTNNKFSPKFDGDCPDSQGQDPDKKEDQNLASEGSNTWLIVIIIIALIIALAVGVFIFRKYKLNKANNLGNDYNKMQGHNISMEDDIGINN